MLLVALFTFGGWSITAVSDAQGGVVCSREFFAVHPGPLLGGQTVSGIYCRPASSPSDTITVLVPGATYNATYWTFPYKPDYYDFALALGRSGDATFSIDPLGTGQSSKPLSALVTASAQAAAVHQVITQIRTTGLAGHAYRKVLLGGHSLGSMISVLEAATYRDVDGVLLTGFGHHLSATNVANVFATDMRPAFLQSRFAGYDPGYLTTSATRSVFYAAQTTDPEVLKVDDATKDVFPAAEAVDGIGLGSLSDLSSRIDAPVLLVDGSLDVAFCTGVGAGDCASSASLYEQESPYFVGSPCFSAFVMPGVGHDVNLSIGAPTYHQGVINWVDAVAAGGCPSGPVTP